MNILAILVSAATLVVAVISIIATFYGIGKFVATLTAAIENAVSVFQEKIDNIVEDIRELKNSQEKLADILNDLSTNQITNLKVDVARTDESTESAHHRINGLECRVSKLEDKQ